MTWYRQLPLATVLLSFLLPAATSLAQTLTYGDAMLAAEQRLDSMNDQGLADAFAFDQCAHGVAERQKETARIWCAIGSRRAVSRIDSWGGPRPGPELDTVRRALWLNAVDGLGLQNNPWWGSPRSETVYIGDGIRGSAYTLIAVINRGERTLPEFRFEGLARIAGVVRERREPMGSLRRRTMDVLLSRLTESPQERENTLWALAAVGLTIDISSRGDDRIAEARQVSMRLRGLALSAEEYEGEDAVLAPALYLAEGWSTLVAEDGTSAEALLGRGTEMCSARLWHGAAMCSMLEYAYARAIAAVRAHSEDEPDSEPPND